jgi:hypothetical protein
MSYSIRRSVSTTASTILRERLLDTQPSRERDDHQLFVGDLGLRFEHVLEILQRLRLENAPQVEVIEGEHDAPRPGLKIARRRPSSEAQTFRIRFGPRRAVRIERIDLCRLSVHEQFDVVFGEVRHGDVVGVQRDDVDRHQRTSIFSSSSVGTGGGVGGDWAAGPERGKSRERRDTAPVERTTACAAIPGDCGECTPAN